MTLTTSHALLKGPSRDVAAALAKAEGSSSSSIHKSVSHRTAAMKRGGRIDLSFQAISSGSSYSSMDEDDDCYEPVNSSSSRPQVVTRNLRTQNSRTPSSSTTATPTEYISPHPRFPAVSRSNGSRFSESEEEEDEVDDEDDDDDDDDDVPLAQRIPGALTAQKFIRKQVRQERERKKQEKALRDHAETTRSRLMTLRTGASSSSSHDASAALAALDSARKRDINGSDGAGAATTPFDAASLNQRLHSLHHSRSLRDIRQPPTTDAPPPVPSLESRSLSSRNQRSKDMKEFSPLPYHYRTSPSLTPINPAYAPPLRPKRSFHSQRPSVDGRPIGMDDPRSVPLPLDAEKLNPHSINTAKSRPSSREGPQHQTSSFPTAGPSQHYRSVSQPRITTLANTIPESVPPIPTTPRIISHGKHHKLFKFSLS